MLPYSFWEQYQCDTSSKELHTDAKYYKSSLVDLFPANVPN